MGLGFFITTSSISTPVSIWQVALKLKLLVYSKIEDLIYKGVNRLGVPWIRP